MKKILLPVAIFTLLTPVLLNGEDLKTIQGMGTYVLFKDSFSNNYGLRLDKINWEKKYKKGGRVKSDQLEIIVTVSGCTNGLEKNPIKTTVTKKDGIVNNSIFYVAGCNTPPVFTIKENDGQIFTSDEMKQETIHGGKAGDWSKYGVEKHISNVLTGAWVAEGGTEYFKYSCKFIFFENPVKVILKNSTQTYFKIDQSTVYWIPGNGESEAVYPIINGNIIEIPNLKILTKIKLQNGEESASTSTENFKLQLKGNKLIDMKNKTIYKKID
jgi:hypothetical protein